jgi:hypothetical protein
LEHGHDIRIEKEGFHALACLFVWLDALCSADAIEGAADIGFRSVLFVCCSWASVRKILTATRHQWQNQRLCKARSRCKPNR